MHQIRFLGEAEPGETFRCSASLIQWTADLHGLAKVTWGFANFTHQQTITENFGLVFLVLGWVPEAFYKEKGDLGLCAPLSHLIISLIIILVLLLDMHLSR